MPYHQTKPAEPELASMYCPSAQHGGIVGWSSAQNALQSTPPPEPLPFFKRPLEIAMPHALQRLSRVQQVRLAVAAAGASALLLLVASIV